MLLAYRALEKIARTDFSDIVKDTAHIGGLKESSKTTFKCPPNQCQEVRNPKAFKYSYIT